MTRIYVTGATGQVGREIQRLYPDAIYLSRSELDLTDVVAVEAFCKDKRPAVLVNCSAYTQVDKAEADMETVSKVNAVSPGIMAKYSERFIHFSTDYVFDGNGHRPYLETDTPFPLGIYGQSKLEGEKLVLRSNPNSIIFRTSWVYSDVGNNFVKTMLRLGRERSELKVVCDQVGTPTYAHDLAKVVVENGITHWNFKPGIYHFSNEGVTSWYDFAKAIFEIKGIPCKVIPINSDEYPTLAKRPHYTVLDKTKIKKDLGIEIPHWKESLRKCLRKLS